MDNTMFSIMDRFAGLKILVVGEAVLDSAVRGKAGRLCVEAPVPVVEVDDGSEALVGAANVASGAARLGAQVEFLTVLGDDREGDRLLDILGQDGVNTSRVIRSDSRTTLLRRRIYAGDQLIVRYDQGSADPIDSEREDQLLDALSAVCAQMDMVILSDFGQGLFTPRVLGTISRLQKEKACLLVADTRRLDAFRDLRLAALRPSSSSALGMANGNHNGTTDPAEKLGDAGEKILAEIDTQVVAITLDDGGALVIDRDTPVYRTYASGVSYNQVRGAGDAFTTALALSLAAGAPVSAAAEIGCAFASIVVENDGLPPCCLDELRVYLSGDYKVFLEWEALGARLEALRQQGKRIVFTNGVFDILHSAHVDYLNEARSFGDLLVIGVNTDESVRRLKGPTRPVNTMLERCRVLAGLSCVDFVVPFGEHNPIELIKVVRPDIYAKGGDYTRETLPEAEVVEGLGGELRIVPYIANHSTTSVIERIRKLTPEQ
jgi:D-beta-D-heptose 7-phosphate kinase / D-beta-D-heptose 1-phosphate adenosyltransferase